MFVRSQTSTLVARYADRFHRAAELLERPHPAVSAAVAVWVDPTEA